MGVFSLSYLFLPIGKVHFEKNSYGALMKNGAVNKPQASTYQKVFFEYTGLTSGAGAIQFSQAAYFDFALLLS